MPHYLINLMKNSNKKPSNFDQTRQTTEVRPVNSRSRIWEIIDHSKPFTRWREPETRTLIGGLAKSLRATRRYRDAAHLCEWHLGDFHQSLECLIEGSLFPDAWALTLRHSMTEQRGSTLLHSSSLVWLICVFLCLFWHDGKTPSVVSYFIVSLLFLL